MSDKERKMKVNKQYAIHFRIFTLLYIIFILFVNKGLPNLWWFWGLITLFLDYFFAPVYSYVYQVWESPKEKRNCKNCLNFKTCKNEHRRMASDEELEHIVCFAWVLSSTKME